VDEAGLHEVQAVEEARDLRARAQADLPPPSLDGESGRGLRVVGELSDRWGCTTPDRAGKVVWAMFGASGQVLPRRVPGRERPGRARRVTVTVTDRHLLARVLHGLENL
jgi:hypothetical protein